MKNFLGKIRERSDEEKDKIIRVAALAGTVTVVIIWITIRLVVHSFEQARVSGVVDTGIQETTNGVSSEFYFLEMVQGLSDVIEVPELPPLESLPTSNQDLNSYLQEDQELVDVENRYQQQDQNNFFEE